MIEYDEKLLVSIRNDAKWAQIWSNTSEFAQKNKNITVHFGSTNLDSEDFYSINYQDATTTGLDCKDLNVKTQESAQHAIEEIGESIILKDKIRANLGATQNRLENTITNLQIQTENLQAAESRISDADVAQEMTAFVKEQILTQSAVAMLAQANTLPQMALQIIQG